MIKKVLLPICSIWLVCHNYAFADEAVGKIIFDCYYANAAWGYQLSGVYIDSTGQIFKYNRNGNPWLPDSVKSGANVYPQSDLMEKYLNTELVGKIGQKMLDEKIQLIKSAATGTISNKATAFDAGERSCVAYIYNRNAKSYRAITLGSKGDVTTINSAPAAQELYAWLQDYWKLEKKK